MPEDQTNPNQTPNPEVSSPDVDTPRPEPTAAPAATSEASTPVVEASPTEQVSPVAPVQTPVAVDGGAPKPSSKKKWIIGGAIAAVIVILGGAGAWAYTAYQDPNKVIVDSAINLLTDQNPRMITTTVSVKNKDVQADITVDGHGSNDQSQAKVSLSLQVKGESPIKLSTSAEVVATKSTLYFKLNDAKKAVDTAADAYIQGVAEQYKTLGYELSKSEIDAQKDAMLSQIDPIIAKVDNRWMKYDVTTQDSSNKDQKCVTDAVTKLQSDSKMQSELTDAYNKNRFVVVKENLGIKDGSYGYVLDLDKAKAKEFSKAAEDTTFGKALKACDSSSSFMNDDDTSEDTVKDSRVELWVSQWSHKVTGFKVSGSDSSDKENPTKVDLDLTMKYGNVDKVVVPTDATDVKDVQKEVEELFNVPANESSVI